MFLGQEKKAVEDKCLLSEIPVLGDILRTYRYRVMYKTVNNFLLFCDYFMPECT